MDPARTAKVSEAIVRVGMAPVLTRPHGGVIQYSLTMLEALRRLQSGGGDDTLVLFTAKTREIDRLLHDMPGWTAMAPEPPGWKTSLRRALRPLAPYGLGTAWTKLKARVVEYPFDVGVVPSSPALARWYRRANVELMLYPTHTELAFQVGIPYVMAVHDVAHRVNPEFPENSAGLLWEWAEHTYRNGARHATLLLADSEVGREEILEIYGRHGVAEDQVKVLPFVPPPYLRSDVSAEESERVRTKYGLPPRYLFYPADTSRHKNQMQIVRALYLLKEEYGVTVPVVLCGFHRGLHREDYLADIEMFARRRGLRDSVHYLDYVPDGDISALYANAAALVMPTFVGPTTIPIYEAWACRCPVLTSDIRGIREQAGDAAILVDPRSVDAIADGIHRLWTDDALRHTLVCRGTQRLASYTFDDFCTRLGDILEEAKARVRRAGAATA